MLGRLDQLVDAKGRRIARTRVGRRAARGGHPCIGRDDPADLDVVRAVLKRKTRGLLSRRSADRAVRRNPAGPALTGNSPGAGGAAGARLEVGDGRRVASSDRRERQRQPNRPTRDHRSTLIAYEQYASNEPPRAGLSNRASMARSTRDGGLGQDTVVAIWAPVRGKTSSRRRRRRARACRRRSDNRSSAE